MPVSLQGLYNHSFGLSFIQIKQKQVQHDKRFDLEDNNFNRLEELMFDVLAQLKKMQSVATNPPVEPSQTYKRMKFSSLA